MCAFVRLLTGRLLPKGSYFGLALVSQSLPSTLKTLSTPPVTAEQLLGDRCTCLTVRRPSITKILLYCTASQDSEKVVRRLLEQTLSRQHRDVERRLYSNIFE